MLKEIKDFPEYFVSEKGKIFSFKNKINMIELVLEIQNNGYVYVNLYKNGKRKHARVHRLVAEAFIENPGSKPVVNHKDGNKQNNDVSNLEWVTHKENCIHCHKNKLQINDKGFDDSQSIPVKCINKITGDITIYGSISIAAKELNLSKSTIAKKNKKRPKYIRQKYYFEKLNNVECNDYSVRK